MLEFIEQPFKSIINKKKFIDSWFWDRYTVNPYNGCLFGCIYCDARSAKYQMPEDFENKIMVKKNVSEMLDKRIANARAFLPDVVGMGGVTDCYQPAEEIYGKEWLLLLEEGQIDLEQVFQLEIIPKSGDIRKLHKSISLVQSASILLHISAISLK